MGSHHGGDETPGWALMGNLLIPHPELSPNSHWGPSPATHCGQNPKIPQNPVLSLFSSPLQLLHPPEPSPKTILSWLSLVTFCPPQTFVFNFLSEPALASSPSSASFTHFINMLFTSACRSLAAILNNWQPAQEAVISGVDDLFYFPSPREQQKHQSWVAMDRPEPGAEMREVAFCLS